MSEVAHTVISMNAEPHPSPRAAEAPASPAWTRVIGVFDLETTGVDVAADRIVTAHVGLLDADGAVILARDWIADPGIDIPDSAAAIHGVTTAHARAVGSPAGAVVEQIVDVLRSLLDAGIPVVAYNAAYDFSLLAHEAQRHGWARCAIRPPSSIRWSSTKHTTGSAAASAHSRPSPNTMQCGWMTRTTPQPTRSRRGDSLKHSPTDSSGCCLGGRRNCTRGRSRGLAHRPRA